MSAAGKVITFAAIAEDAVRLLLSGNPANVADVAKATGQPPGQPTPRC